MPVFVLYFFQHMSLGSVLRLEAIYYLGVVVLEVPSGLERDRIPGEASRDLAQSVLQLRLRKHPCCEPSD